MTNRAIRRLVLAIPFTLVVLFCTYSFLYQRDPDRLIIQSLELYHAGKYQESYEAARSAATINPEYAAAHINMCAALIMLGKPKEAVAAGERAVELDPASEQARSNLAWAKQRMTEARQ